MRRVAVRLIVLMMFLCGSAGLVLAAKPYKIYVVNRYGAYDIVCDAYTVKKDDHIWDILRRKGSIAEQDFPRFVRILKDLNPGIADVNRIYPRQKILIPLKEMPAVKAAGTPGPRYITIPMLPDVLYRNYRVHPGECLSKIITAHLQVRWDELTDAYMKTFRRLNPRITNLDLIYPGQTLRIPALSAAQYAAEQPVRVVAQEPAPGAQEQQVGLQAGGDERAAATAAIGVPRKGSSEQGAAEQSKGVKVASKQKPAVASTKTAAETPMRPGAEIKKQKKSLEPIREGKDKKVVPPMAAAGTQIQEKRVVEHSAETPEPPPFAGKVRMPAQSRAVVHAERRVPRAVEAARVRVVTSVSSRYKAGWQDTVAAVARGVAARFLDTGHCYFPDPAGKDVVVDLAAFPVIELETGRHVLFDKGNGLAPEVEGVIRRSWKDLLIVHAAADDPAETILDKAFAGLYGQGLTRERTVSFSDGAVKVALRGDWVISCGVGQKKQPEIYCVTLVDAVDKVTAAPAVAYLAEHNIAVIDVLTKDPQKRPAPWTVGNGSNAPPVTWIDGSGQVPFVSGFARALGWFYEPNVPLSFDYAGFQVETAASVIYSPTGADVVVDFGTFYGDTASALEAGGMQVVSVQPADPFYKIAGRLLEAMGVAHSMNPELLAANRAVSRACAVTISGCLITGEKADKALLAQKALHPALIAFLNGQHIKVLQVKTRP